MAGIQIASGQRRYVYRFGGGVADGMRFGPVNRRNLLGGKGLSLCEMAYLSRKAMEQGIPLRVPPGFTISTEAAVYYMEHKKLPPGLNDQVEQGMKFIQSVTGRVFGSTTNPQVVAVRSGARQSMPGMMDTYLSIGLNSEIMPGLSGNIGPWTAADCLALNVKSFGTILFEIGEAPFRAAINAVKKKEGLSLDPITDKDISVDGIVNGIIPAFKKIIEDSGNAWPSVPAEQLWTAIQSVFDSWSAPTATTYRKLNNIPHHWGTAVNVQAMVFGNIPKMGNAVSGTGVMITRDNTHGKNVEEISFLPNFPGEAVVSGLFSVFGRSDFVGMVSRRTSRDVFRAGKFIEDFIGDVGDVEFTIQAERNQRGAFVEVPWFLQNRPAKRTPAADVAFKVAYAKEGRMSRMEAVEAISPETIAMLLVKQVDKDAQATVIAEADAATMGAEYGRVVFTPEDSVEMARRAHEEAARTGEPVEEIGLPALMRKNTTTEDYFGMQPAIAIGTEEGSAGCHAAIVCKGENKVGLFSMNVKIDHEKKQMTLSDGSVVKEGEWITVDANESRILKGKVPLVLPQGLTPAADTLLKWADSFATMGVRANADTPEQMAVARNYGAKGVGLLRIEHWIQSGSEEAKALFQQWVMEADKSKKLEILAGLKALLKPSLKESLRVMAPYPVTVRLLDPPLHEFLPVTREIIEKLAVLKSKKVQDNAEINRLEAELSAIESHHEANPMLGDRGVRLGIAYPELTEMQAEAIYEAQAELIGEGVNAKAEVMVPVVSLVLELEHQKKILRNTHRQVIGNYGLSIYKMPEVTGTMIELPAAALASAELARHAKFFSFGTNDKTQTTYGFSRDDLAPRLTQYQEAGILDRDPFSVLMPGVEELMQISIERGRSVKPNLKIGICGEHGRDPESIRIAHRLGLSYVSPSGIGIPIARLVAAQAAIADIKAKEETEK